MLRAQFTVLALALFSSTWTLVFGAETLEEAGARCFLFHPVDAPVLILSLPNMGLPFTFLLLWMYTTISSNTAYPRLSRECLQPHSRTIHWNARLRVSNLRS